MKFQNIAEVQEFAHQHKKVLVINQDQVLDVTSFAVHHPGGPGLILKYKNKDISEQLKNHQILSYKLADSLSVGYFEKEIKKFLTPEKALMSQIWQLKHQDYIALVNSPHWLFVQSPPMFQSRFLQFFSHNKWYHILIFHLIWTSYYLYQIDWSNITMVTAFSRLFLGICIFSLVEYTLHRFLFHSQSYLPNNKYFRILHFTLHGVHHMLPIDPDRLVFPPPLAVIFILIGQQLYKFIDPNNLYLYMILQVGIIYGYLMYDMIHYGLHHIQKMTGYFGNLQRYHNRHHFSGQDAGYGVSSKFWDLIFGTEFKKKISKHV